MSKAAAGKFADHGGDLFEESRAPRVVGVEQGDVFAPCLGDAAVPGGGNPRVGLPDETYERRSDRFGPLGAAVRRTVVHDDDFGRKSCLREHGTQGRFDFALLVVEGDDHRDEGFRHVLGGFIAKIPIFCYFCK